MNIKYGAHIYLWIKKWDKDKLYLFERAKQLGLDCLEISTGDDVPFDAKLVKDAADKLDMEVIISPGGHWPMEADLAHEEPEYRMYGLDWHKKWVEQGAEAGAIAYTGALYAHPGRIEHRAPDDNEYKRSAENLHQLAEFADKFGIKIVCEPMSHFRTHLVNTPRQVMKLLNLADHHNLYVLLDTYHMITEVREFASGIRLMKDKLWCVHACENDRGVPGGGLVPWKSIFDTLKEINYKGYMILETYNSSVPDFAYSRGMFHNVCPDGDEFVRKGVSFLKSFKY
jgi:D-psicose/D-tagatose/L-ribulose 3-epimerase